jgi:DNA-binding NarL/FixJ family response regulator
MTQRAGSLVLASPGVAAGRGSQQIAAELFISAKTASVHVSNILGKLQVSSRVEAFATAHWLRPFDPA